MSSNFILLISWIGFYIFHCTYKNNLYHVGSINILKYATASVLSMYNCNNSDGTNSLLILNILSDQICLTTQYIINTLHNKLIKNIKTSKRCVPMSSRYIYLNHTHVYLFRSIVQTINLRLNRLNVSMSCLRQH